jgi:diketogulonate reductase-like aldo/keto reductase
MALVSAGLGAVANLMRLNDGHTIPRVGLGVFKMSSDEARRSVLSALHIGYRLIDTARYYANEAEVGAAVRESGVPRSEVFVTTKIWLKDSGYQQMLSAGLDSNKRLGLGYIDLLLLHVPFYHKTESWRALEELRRLNIARSIGVSNFSIPDLKELLPVAKIPPAVNQIEIHPFFYRKEVVQYCQNAGIVMQAYSPLGKGLRLNEPVLVDIAKQVGRTPAQVLLRWGLDHNFVVLPKSVTPQWQQENLDLNFELPEEHLNILDCLFENPSQGVALLSYA